MKTFRLIRSPANSADYNMALDEKIFQRYLEDGIGILRLYRWQSPSFTYGFSQEPQKLINLAHCANDGVGVAKRITGGGVLFHDDEITYSFACSKADVNEPQGIFVSYRNLCAFIMRFYKSLGLAPVFALEAADYKSQSAASSEICSIGHEKYDIVINGKKIGGNAQKRKRQVIFQHGSIPCRINWDFAQKYLNFPPGNLSSGATALADELKVVPQKEILEQKLIDAFSSEFSVNFIEENEFAYQTSLVG